MTQPSRSCQDDLYASTVTATMPVTVTATMPVTVTVTATEVVAVDGDG